MTNVMSVILDWTGSIMMLSTLWTWVYEKAHPLIQQRVSTFDRRLDALRRLIWIRYVMPYLKLDGGDRTLITRQTWDGNMKDTPLFRRYREYRAELGVDPTATRFQNALYLAILSIRLESAYQEGRITREKYELMRNYEAHRAEILKLSRVAYLIGVRNKILADAFEMLDKLTHSVFRGKPRLVLFTLGFLLWNLGKALSLFH